MCLLKTREVNLHDHVKTFNLCTGLPQLENLKNDKSFCSPGKVLEFYNFIKNPGKMGVNLENELSGKIVLS